MSLLCHLQPSVHLNAWLSKPLPVYMKMSCFHFATCFPALRGLLSRLSFCVVHVGKMEGVLSSEVWMENNWSIQRVSSPEKRRRAHLYDRFKNEANNLGHLGRCPPGSRHNPCDGNIMKVIIRERKGQKGKAIREKCCKIHSSLWCCFEVFFPRIIIFLIISYNINLGFVIMFPSELVESRARSCVMCGVQGKRERNTALRRVNYRMLLGHSGCGS